MTLPSEQLALAWNSLAASAETGEGWRSIAVSPAGAALVHAGLRFPSGAEAILVRFSASSVSTTVKLPDGGGFLVELVSLEDGFAWVALTRREAGSLDLFASMASDVATALSSCPAVDEAKSLSTLLGRVRAWQEFMRKGGAPLSAEAEIGLFGELSLLRAILDEGLDVPTVCDAWRGPLGGLRDFEIGTGGIEVKSTLTPSGFRAKVGSLEQLDDTERQPLFLAAVRLCQIQGGQSLPDAVETTRDIIAGDLLAERLLAERLIASGYRDRHADTYTRRFKIAEVQVYRVDQRFPRLTPHSVPQGVERASYVIDIEKADPTATVDLCHALTELRGF